MLNIITIPASSDNYMHMGIVGGMCFVVDPTNALLVEQEIASRGVSLDMILNTHHHFDHTGGNARLQKKTHCQIISGDDARTPGNITAYQVG